MLYFNNSQGREHARIYGNDAFYDLDTSGRHSSLATHLEVGEQCIVATPASDGQIVFTWFSFKREDVKPDDTGHLCRVFIGERLKSDTLSKSIAARDSRYSNFFDKN